MLAKISASVINRASRRAVGFGALALACTACAGGPVRDAVRRYEAGDYRAALVAAARAADADADDEGAWRMVLRAALALGDGAALTREAERYRAAIGQDDAELALELAEATLAQGLRSPSVALRVAAIRAVEQSELRGLADAVAERMTDRDDRVVAAAAAAVLRGYADAATALDDMLRSEDPQARLLALDGLGRKVAKHAVPELVAGAGDAEPAVRRNAVAHLAALRDPALAALLLERARDVDAGVRAAALEGLTALGAARGAGAVRAAEAALRDPALGVRLAAVRLVAALGRQELLSPLVERAEPSVALAAARALGGGALAVPAVERGLTSASWSERAATLNQLAASLGGRAPGPSAAERARPLLADPVPAVRLAAARVLAHAGLVVEAAPVFAAVAAPLAERAERADALGNDLDALGLAVDAAVDQARLGDARGEQALARALALGVPALRSRAVAAHLVLGRITPGLWGALADPSGAVRVEAAATLASLARALD